MIKYRYFMAIFLLITSVSYADVSDKLLDKLLSLSGLESQINQFPDLIKVGLNEAKQKNHTTSADTAYKLMLKSAQESIVPLTIIDGMKASLKNSLNEKEVKKLLLWYESDLGKEITRAEENAATSEAYQQMLQSAPSLLQNTQRIELANRFDTLSGATDLTMRLQKYGSIAIYSATMTAVQPNVPLNLAAYEAQLDTQDAQIRAEIKQSVILSFVYAHQNIEMAKLKKYESFLNDITTIKFNKIIADSMNKELESSILKWASILATELTK